MEACNYLYEDIYKILKFNKTMDMSTDETAKLKTHIASLISLIADIKVNHYFLAASLITDKHNIGHIRDNAEELEKKIWKVLEEVAND